MFGMNKKEQEFYGLFNESMDLMCSASVALVDLLTDFVSTKEKAAHIKQIELSSDNQTHKILEILNAAFITPFDRDDMYQLVKEMDNIVDGIEEVSNRFSIFNVAEARTPSIEMAKIIMQCTFELKDLFSKLDEMGKTDFLKYKIIEINRLENEGDVLHRTALETLFNEETNPVEIIKWKYLFEYLENAIDACETIANLVQGLIMKHSN
ncbi:MAG: DUF47 family protein [Eubacteriales bacterium]